MCGGLEYQYLDPVSGQMKTRKAYFPIPKVKIPVVIEDNSEPEWVQWGKRQGEDPELDVPVTGWARLLSLKEGKWNRYQPRKVKIPALRWMEKDAEKQSHWFDMEPEKALLGVMLVQQGERFVYIVTRPATEHYAMAHHRMPLLVEAAAPAPIPSLT